MVAEMARANNEQAEGVAGVNQAVGEMDRNTQQNAALVEEAAAATHALSEQASGLLELVNRFKVDATEAQVSFAFANTALPWSAGRVLPT
jgi:methyl-accepting chemotaxis protein